MGLVAILCLINAMRRTSRDLDVGPQLDGAFAFFLGWLAKTAQATASGLLVAIPVALAVVVTYNLAPRRAALRYPAVAIAIAASCIVGVALMIAVESVGSLTFVEHESLLAPALVAVVRYALLCTLVAAVFIYVRVADESSARADQALRDRARFVQRLEEARLKMLQAQIEPHFLFNSLANVRSLHATAAPEAQGMLDNLVQYFAAALPHLRAADSTLGREAALTTSYLEIQAIRMGRRLTFAVTIPEALGGVPFPPLMLLTLAENAIKHGLAPQRGGGAVRIDATLHDGELRVRVADSGRGFVQTSGGGTGLANIRARLAAMYGESGRLSLTRNSPQGVVATIAIPLARAPTPASAR
ncbi:MAG: histidine kinase [Burkholderiales bacterium]|nr:histidine kinase [Burkholderiales bacterium]